ncbi:LptF/LptG family permease [Flavobacterium sp.]|uniref:LptF/LptG family permease n=1 Tax=Flavobacterium sp. TaxID=239 RepID=UPI003C3C506D
MKILDKYLLKTFLITFATVFVILFFIFILQTIWLFIAELAGKDLDILMILKFLVFSMPRIVPLVLPLSILLASIMTFGNLAENYEFAAMKSSGISLQRTLRGLTVFIAVLSIVAFLFANNVIPYAEYKFINFRKNIAQVQPALAITEGQFSDVGIYNIKVNKKSGKNGNNLTGITIHKKSSMGDGSKIVIKSKDGELISSEQSSVLQLVLNDGNYYEDVIPKKYEDRLKLPFAKSSFKKYTINIDLSQLNKPEDNGQDVSNSNTMLTVNELNYTLDSLQKNMKTEVISFSENITLQTGITNLINTDNKINNPKKDSISKLKEIPKDILSIFSNPEKMNILTTASSNLVSIGYNIDASKVNLENKQKTINDHVLALYDKFVIAYACFLMFFIGAPLGAIIRKGGLGLPIVFAVLIFITFHFINTFGKRISQEDGLSPFLGAWMSSFILTPLAIFLTYRATNDIGLINMDAIFTPIQKIFKKLFQKQK